MPDPSVAIPDNAVMDLSADEKVLPQLTHLLTGLNMLSDGTPNANSGGPLEAPDPAIAIIESSATKLTKLWAVVVGAAGGVTGLVAWLANFWNTQHDGVRITLIAGGTALLAVTAVALAVLVASDVRARAHGAAAIYQARADVAVEFLRVSTAAWTLKNAPPESVVVPAEALTDVDQTLSDIKDQISGVNSQVVVGVTAVSHLIDQVDAVNAGAHQLQDDVTTIKNTVLGVH